MIKLDLNSIEGYVANRLKLFISMAAGLLVFVGIIAVSIFFIAVRGEEQTMVPEVRGKELTGALLELQEKELYPRIQLRFSQSPLDRGLILEQEPKAGTIVKAGRRVRLVVSQGVLQSRVENYIGRNIDEVRLDLQALIAAPGGVPLLSIKEPVMYDYSPETPGTILRQKPEAGFGISGPQALEFVVSRGRENAAITVPQLTGLSLASALDLIGKTGINFHFSLRELKEGEKEGVVVYQEPAANTSVAANAPVNLVVNKPAALKAGEVFKLFRYTMSRNPYPLTVRLEAIPPSGERIRLLGVEYSGGEFTVPYRLPEGTTLVLLISNHEIYRETVTGD